MNGMLGMSNNANIIGILNIEMKILHFHILTPQIAGSGDCILRYYNMIPGHLRWFVLQNLIMKRGDHKDT